jgi:hypothetical protein
LGLLCAGSDRPSCRRTTNNAEKFPSSHADPQVQEEASYRLKQVRR